MAVVDGQISNRALKHDRIDSIVSHPIRQIGQNDFPERLREIPDAPQSLYIRGSLPPPQLHTLAVVGSRKMSAYGKRTCQSLIAGLAGQPIAIISGLALGIDAIAHEAALSNKLYTLAVLPSGLSDAALYPALHRPLAQKILQRDGALISEYDAQASPATWTFPARNRIMAGLSEAVLIIEAAEKSGTRITARLATEYNREVLAVPHPVDSETGAGGNALIRLGATLVRSAADILDAFNITLESVQKVIPALSPDEQLIYDTLTSPYEREEIAKRCNLSAQRMNIAFSMLLIKGLIKEELGKILRV